VPDVCEGLLPLSSLLTGLIQKDQPIQILNLSFRHFLTSRAQVSPVHRHFHAEEQKHNEQLAFLCIRVLNEDLTLQTPGTGYLSTDTEGIPSLDNSDVSEVLWYACRFWMDIITIEHPVSENLLDSLRESLESKMTLWMEVLVTQYPLQTLSKVRIWIQAGATNLCGN
jgi:hypothetical protein